MDLNELGWGGCGLGSTGLQKRTVVCFCLQGNTHLGSKKDNIFLDYLIALSISQEGLELYVKLYKILYCSVSSVYVYVQMAPTDTYFDTCQKLLFEDSYLLRCWDA
jgi:hypothetical protein